MATESIYTWVREAEPPVQRPPRYESRFSATATALPPNTTMREAARKKAHGVMGAEVRATIKPSEFLRAHEKTGALTPDPASMPAKYVRPEPPRKPTLPTRAELAERAVGGSPGGRAAGAETKKDFITANAVDAMLTAPKRPAASTVDWTAKPDYGRVPAYLATVKQAVAEETAYINRMLTDQAQRDAEAAAGARTRELPAGERAELLESLKAKHDAVTTLYQRITFRNISTSSSTMGEIRWKEQCERQLSELEADIARLSVPGPIYVVEKA